MRIDLHVHIDLPPEVLGLFGEMSRKLDLVLNTLEIVMSLETEALDKLEASTALINGAEDSAEAAFIRLADMIAGLKTSATDPATAARITAAADALRARADKLAAAVAATPA